MADITHLGHRPAGDDTNALTGGSRLLITAGPAPARHHWADAGWGRSTKTVITRRQWWRGGHSNFQAKRWPRFLPQSSLGPFWLSSFAKSIRSAHEVSSGRFVYSICLRSKCAGNEMGARLGVALSVACSDSGGFVVCIRGIGA